MISKKNNLFHRNFTITIIIIKHHFLKLIYQIFVDTIYNLNNKMKI